jgi:hypothetical protein
VNDAQEQKRLAARGLDVTVPNVARIYDYILGGTTSTPIVSPPRRSWRLSRAVLGLPG